ncbi:MAG: prolipoprotein diacylglyceryl transferase [Gemmatimonadetes bacterium]|nr:prolipoprotein diacylglyceryl transferase [Gemmatimonadota bacterium]
MPGSFVHRIDPILGSIGGVHLWWYGLSYAVGFLNIHWWVRKTNPTPGATAARFVFWYAFLRIFIDLFRDYPTHRFALGTGQTLNIVMALLGLVLLARSRLRRLGRLAGRTAWPAASTSIGKRHPGLNHSWIYPQIDTTPRPAP